MISSSQLISGSLAALIGFASSFAIVLSGLQAMGASATQAAIGLGILNIATGLLSIALGLYLKMPAALAWSTPGAAFLATIAAPAGGFPEACGAFLISSLAIAVTGWISPLRQAVEAIPSALSSAMLAGILLNICLIPVHSLVDAPALVAPVIVTWFLVGLVSSLWAVPAALAAAGVVMFMGGYWPDSLVWQLTPFQTLTPSFSLSSLVGIAIPLYLITMTSQNLAGMAVLKGYGYQPPLSPILKSTGLFSAVASFFGGHHINLASLTSAMCANPGVGPKDTRWWAVIAGGVVFILMGLGCAVMIPIALAAPANLIPAIAGLALINATAGALKGAFYDDRGREAAVVCFVVTVAGVSILGVGSAFWGLVAGGLIWRLKP